MNFVEWTHAQQRSEVILRQTIQRNEPLPHIFGHAPNQMNFVEWTHAQQRSEVILHQTIQRNEPLPHISGMLQTKWILWNEPMLNSA